MILVCGHPFNGIIFPAIIEYLHTVYGQGKKSLQYVHEENLKSFVKKFQGVFSPVDFMGALLTTCAHLFARYSVGIVMFDA